MDMRSCPPAISQLRKVQPMTRYTRCLSLHLGCCLLLCLAGGVAFGSDNEFTLSKTQPVVLKIPRQLLKYEDYSFRGRVPIYTANVSVVGETIIVEGESDWQLRGWPPLLTLVYEKTSKEKEYTEIEFRSNLAYVKLRFAAATPNVEEALRELVFLGTSDLFEFSEEFNALTEKLLPIKFSGVLAEIPRDKQFQLIKDLGYNDDEMGIAEFQGKQYIAFSPTSSIPEFNSRDVKQAARVATVLRDFVLPAFDKVAPVITDAKGIYGIKIRARIFYRDIIPGPRRNQRQNVNQRPNVEVLDIFAPYDLVEKLYNSEITNQKLVDGSTVLVNGDRIEVDLSKAARTSRAESSRFNGGAVIANPGRRG
jgi:hypothetical protein